MHQNRASLFASNFYRRRGYRKEVRSEGHFYPFSSQKKSRFASDFLRRGNRASWGLKTSRDFSGSGKNRRRNCRESRDFGALRSPTSSSSQKVGLILTPFLQKFCRKSSNVQAFKIPFFCEFGPFSVRKHRQILSESGAHMGFMNRFAGEM